MGESKTNAISAKATIYVSTKASSTVVFSKSGTSYTKTADSSGNAYLDVAAKDFGTWSISVTNSYDSGSGSVNVTQPQQYNVSVALKRWIVRNGQVVSGWTMTKTGNKSTLTQETSYVKLHSGYEGESYGTCSFTPTMAFPVGTYKYLVCEHQGRGYYNSAGCPAYGVLDTIRGTAQNSTFVAMRLLTSGNTDSLTAKATTYVDISGVTGTRSVGFQMAGSANASVQGDFYCYNLYLSDTTS